MAKRVDPQHGTWRIDLHMHTAASDDSVTSPTDLVARAREIGLARIAVTDHNSIEGALEAQSLAPDLVIVGEEIAADTGGELIAYFVKERVPAGLPVPEIIRLLRAQGALISVSHPCDRLRGSALGREVTEQIAAQIDAIEVFNARCLLGQSNTEAASLARKLGLPGTAGSDAHTLAEVGAGYVTVAPFRGTREGLLGALNEGVAGGRLTGILPHFASRRAHASKRSTGR